MTPTTHDLFTSPSPPTRGFSHLSAATLSATPTALILLGCVQTMLHLPPSPRSMRSSSTNWGTCVVFPHPVSPLRTTTCKPRASGVSFGGRGWLGGKKRHQSKLFTKSKHRAAATAADDAVPMGKAEMMMMMLQPNAERETGGGGGPRQLQRR